MNFFATGNVSFATGLNLNFMTPIGSRSKNFSRDGQNLQQSFSIAQNVFKQVGCGKITFKALGHALKAAVTIDEKIHGVPSTKGLL